MPENPPPRKPSDDGEPIMLAVLSGAFAFFGFFIALTGFVAVWRHRNWQQLVGGPIGLLGGGVMIALAAHSIYRALRTSVNRARPGDSAWGVRLGPYLLGRVKLGNVLETLPRIGLAGAFIAALNGWPLPMTVSDDTWRLIPTAEAILMHATLMLGAMVLFPWGRGIKQIGQVVVVVALFAIYVGIAQAELPWTIVIPMLGMTGLRIGRALFKPIPPARTISHALAWGLEFFFFFIIYGLTDARHGGVLAALRFGAFYYPILSVLGVLGYLNVDATAFYESQRRRREPEDAVAPVE